MIKSDNVNGYIYSTIEVARLAEVHPNTVRLYEKQGFINPIERAKNNYRLYKEASVLEMQMARLLLRNTTIEPVIREKAEHVVRLHVLDDNEATLKAANTYLQYLLREKSKAEKALKNMIAYFTSPDSKDNTEVFSKRKEMADYLEVSIDVLRNWEMNGLIDVMRNPSNGYRNYTQKDANRLEVIKILRKANYGLIDILEMLKQIDNLDKSGQAGQASSPKGNLYLEVATNRWIDSLSTICVDAQKFIEILINKTNHPP